MRIEPINYDLSQLRQQQKIAATVDRNVSNFQSGGQLSEFERLQLKAAYFQQRETGFLPRLDARLALALSALNDNTTLKTATNSSASNAYKQTSQLA